MLVNSDPATFIVLIFMLLLLLAALRLRHTRRMRQEGRRRLAEATGHPSTFARSGQGSRQARSMMLAHELAVLGLLTERRGDQPIVRARALAGVYKLIVGLDSIIVEYETPAGDLLLLTPGARTVEEAVRVVAEHADLPIPA